MSEPTFTRRKALRLGGLVVGGSLLGTPVAAKAGPNAVFDLDFSSAADVADNSDTAPGWVPDRTEPGGFSTESFDSASRLEIEIDASGDTDGFYAYQGKKYLDADGQSWHAGTGSRFSYRFYIDPAWEDDEVGQQTGMWLVLGDDDGDVSAYPILEYQDSTASDTGEAGFRVYGYDSDGEEIHAKWNYIGLPKRLHIDPDEGGWVTVEAQLQAFAGGAALKWRINNKLVADERGYNLFAPSTQFLEPILNSANFGVDQQYYYDDIVLETPGHASNR